MASHRGEGNSGGIGEGMQYQNPPDREARSGGRSPLLYEEAGGGATANMPSTTDNAFVASSGAQGNVAGDEAQNVN